MNEGNRCKSCRWYRPTIADGGECRRRSPGVVKHDAVWPWVHGVDYCGDWTPADEPELLDPEKPRKARKQLDNI